MDKFYAHWFATRIVANKGRGSGLEVFKTKEALLGWVNNHIDCCNILLAKCPKASLASLEEGKTNG